MTEAVLFVGNLSSMATGSFLERLFSAYGRVVKVEFFGNGSERYAEVTFSEIDDADVAISSLHCRYCSSKSVPLIVLYSRNSPYVSQYGRQVGEEFAKCMSKQIAPAPVPLVSFDPVYSRNSNILPPSETTEVAFPSSD